MEFHEVRVSVSDFRFQHQLHERKTISISTSDFRLQFSCSRESVCKRVNFKVQHLSFNFGTEGRLFCRIYRDNSEGPVKKWIGSPKAFSTTKKTPYGLQIQSKISRIHALNTANLNPWQRLWAGSPPRRRQIDPPTAAGRRASPTGSPGRRPRPGLVGSAAGEACAGPRRDATADARNGDTTGIGSRT